MMFEVIIKDNSFLPETVDIKTNTEVSFQNEDGVQHKIHCKGSFNFPSLTIDAGGSKRYKFANPGKYLISDISHGDAKVRVKIYFVFLHCNVLA